LKKEEKQPIVRIIEKVIDLAILNHQPIRLEEWEKNQESGYFGDPIR